MKWHPPLIHNKIVIKNPKAPDLLLAGPGLWAFKKEEEKRESGRNGKAMVRHRFHFETAEPKEGGRLRRKVPEKR